MFGTALRLGVLFAVLTLWSQSARAGVLAPPCEGCVWSSELPDTPFHAVLARRSVSVSSGLRYGEFTFAGPNLPTMEPLTSGVGEIARDPTDGTYFAMGLHVMYTLDRVANRLTAIVLPSSLPEFSWMMAMTYDQTRSRLLVATLGGTGYIYAYSSASRDWSVLADLGGRDLTALAHHPLTDRLYGISFRGSGDQLLEFSPEGHVVRGSSLDLTQFGSPEFLIDRAIQMFAVDEYLAVVVPDVENVPRIFVIDPTTGEMRRVVPIPEPSACLIALTGVTFVASTVVRQRRRSRNRALRETNLL